METIWDLRRKARYHFLAKAENAKLCAYALSHRPVSQLNEIDKSVECKRDFSTAFQEGFLREASISIELILKAYLCLLHNRPPPVTHDVFDLWTQAALPDLSNDDWYRLAFMTECLYWLGRYAAPNSDKQLRKGNERYKKFGRYKMVGKLRVDTSMPLQWNHFEELYDIVYRQFWLIEGGVEDFRD